jgi:hypothetical protein
MRKIYQTLKTATLLVFILAAANAFAAKVTFPGSGVVSGGATYCNGTTAAALTFTITNTTCGSGVNTNIGTSVSWFRNAVNSNSGGTLVAGPVVSNAGTTVFNYTPSTATNGTLYYYAVISWNAAGCATAGSVTSNTTAVIVNPPPTWYADADLDTYGNPAVSTTACTQPAGYVSNSTDCNDAAPAINPGAAEICDGIDNDCDGMVDEGLTTVYYRDFDGDTYGDAAMDSAACSQPVGYVSNNTDCNDAVAAINPAATEVCDGVDNNCDGMVDEGLTTLYYRDFDGDTYGDAAMDSAACSQPVGYVTNSTDCNDAVAAINPVATEVCDGVDNNCDGSVDEGFATSVYYLDFDGDTYGDASMDSSACFQPVGYVTDSTDCNDTIAAINPAGTEICDGLDNDCDGLVDEGVKTVYYLDFDGDTYGDAAMDSAACSPPVGYVANSTDCNDTVAAINPGATEICDGIDNDCDGMVDEGVTTVYYRDFDGDTYGDAAMDSAACSLPVGYVSNSYDCNDTVAGINPFATEVCDGVDNNCDGSVDEGFATAVYYLDFDGDTYGDASMDSTSCFQPVGYVTDSTDCNDTVAAINPAATEICDGLDNDCDGMVDEGVTTVYYLDFDGDTYGDASMEMLQWIL